MFALEPGKAGPLLRELGKTLPRPRAIAIVSPHWTTRGAAVCTANPPETIHDFGGFDPRLYEMQYKTPKMPTAVEFIREFAIDLIVKAGYECIATERWGLDHGAWVPLTHLYPQADIPVFQISQPAGLDCRSAFAYGQALADLREHGVLFIGSGSLTHNLRELNFNRRTGVPTAAYVQEFMNWVRSAVARNDLEALKHSDCLAPHYSRAHPTDEHYLPLLVALGAAAGAKARLLDGGVSYGLISMDSYVFDQ
jgi:4,5-DOPA dioxygenase extradiol